MAKKNYNSMSKTTNRVEETIETKQVNEETKVEETKEVKKLFGVVSNCEKLNVRKHPNIKSEVESVIGKGVEVEITNIPSTKDFYPVIVKVNESEDSLSEDQYVKGYCMKKYISVKE